MIPRFPARYSLCDWPWATVQQRDVQPQGQPESCVRVHGQARLGLLVRASERGWLGGLAVTCRVRGEELEPMGLAVTWDREEDAW